METVKFSKAVYALQAIKKAAYKFIDKISVNIRDESENYLVDLIFTKEISPEAKIFLLSEFSKEVLDQDLRESIKTETEAYRNLILAHVFSKTPLVTDE
jgi:His-Xaa-Ser system protein HxsD